jgi:hypothetical protein
MRSKGDCATCSRERAIPRLQLRAKSSTCSAIAILAILCGAPAWASPASLHAAGQLRTLHEAGGRAGLPPLIVRTLGAAPDFRVRDVSGPAGRPIPLRIEMLDDKAANDPVKLFIVSGVPDGVTLNPGGNLGEFWAVNASVIKDLTVTAPPGFSGSFTLNITRSRREADLATAVSITVSIGQPDTRPTAAPATSVPDRTATVPPRSAGGRDTIASETMLMDRATASFKKGDVSGARVIYEYLATQGSASAAMAMGETYDPLVLGKMAIKGLAPDPGKARQWYEEAEKLGSGDARRRLNALAAR